MRGKKHPTDMATMLLLPGGGGQDLPAGHALGQSGEQAAGGLQLVRP